MPSPTPREQPPHRPRPAWDASSRHHCLPAIDRARDRRLFQSKHEITGGQSLPPPQSRAGGANLAQTKRSPGWVFQVPHPRERAVPPHPRLRAAPSSQRGSAGGRGSRWDGQEAAGPAGAPGRSPQPTGVGGPTSALPARPREQTQPFSIYFSCELCFKRYPERPFEAARAAWDLSLQLINTCRQP